MPRLIFVVFFVCLIIPWPAFSITLDVEADSLIKAGDRIEAKGNVVVTGKDIGLNADYVVYDVSSDDLWATGDCYLKEEQGEISAESLYYNARRKDAHIEGGSVFVYEDPIIITGESITRYGRDLYLGRDIDFTPCIGDDPAWSFAASDLEIPIEGYGTVWHARFKLRGLPVLYTPFMLFPAKLQRQSGVLFPEISHSSDYGHRTGIPLYLVLGRPADLTVTPTRLSKRGLLLRAQMRYVLDYEQVGEIYVESLRDKRHGEEYVGYVTERIPDRRWFVKALQRGGDLTWDINLVSTEDYFRDIGTLYGKEEDWKKVSDDEDDDDLEELISRMQWIKSANGFTASISGQWKQDLSVIGDEKTFQEVPRLKARMNQRDIPYTPWKITSEISTTRVYTLDWIEAIKDDMKAELSWPISLQPYLTLRPFVEESYRDTFFADIRDEYDHDSYGEHWQKRGVKLTTGLYSPRFVHGLYHHIVPDVSWTYNTRFGENYDPTDADDVYPNILSEDDREKEFDMELGLTNYLRDKSGKALIEAGISRMYSYLTEDWEPFEAKVKFQPVEWISLTHTNKFSREPFHPYATTEHSSVLTIGDTMGDEFSVSEEYNRVDTKSILIGVKLNLSNTIDARFSTEHDYLERRYEYSRQALSYTSQCWGIDLYRETEPSEDDMPRKTTLGLTVRLLGLGDVVHASYREKSAEDVEETEGDGFDTDQGMDP